jgi:hypothetical protein
VLVPGLSAARAGPPASTTCTAREIPAFAKPTFERLRRTRHTAQYFDPSAAPITELDAAWAIEKTAAAVSGVKVLLAGAAPERFA